MERARKQDALQQQADMVRSFNRYYTARLGLLRGRYLNSEFSLTEARILYELGQGLEVTAASLRRSLCLDAGYMSRLLASFERRGLVQRKPSRHDGRVLLLKLTASGKRSAARLDLQSSQEVMSLLETLPLSERLALLESVGTVQQILLSTERRIEPESAAEIVRATVSQTADARTLLNEYYREVGVIQKDTAESVQQFLGSPDSGLWIAYVGDTPAGCVVLRPLKGLRASGECKRLYVRAPFRRRGIAEALLDALEEYARGSSLSWIYLDSKDDLQAAITLYRRRGYKLCERYNENIQATIFLRKSLRA